MRRVNQVASLIILAFSIWVMIEARNLTYYTELGPGPGFFPFWLGLFIGGLSVAWLFQATTKPEEPMPEDFVPGAGGLARMFAIIASLVVFSLLVETVGFRLMMFAFLAFLLTVLGRRGILLTVIICSIGSFGLAYLFANYLDVFMPTSSIEFLANLGL